MVKFLYFCINVVEGRTQRSWGKRSGSGSKAFAQPHESTRYLVGLRRSFTGSPW
jgi:hypothetical protein